MLHKSKSARTALWKYGLSAPLFAGMLIFSAACVKPETEEIAVKFSPPVIEVSDEIILPATLQDDLYPEFPGGMSEFIEFVSENYKYPSQAIKNDLTGEIITSFVIEKDGSLTGIQVVKDLGYGTSEEAIRMLKTSPKWKPGMQNGKAVSVGYTLPIKIDLLKVGQDRLKVDAMIFEWKLQNDNE